MGCNGLRQPRTPAELYSGVLASAMEPFYDKQAELMGIQWKTIMKTPGFLAYQSQVSASTPAVVKYVMLSAPRGAYAAYKKRSKYYDACMDRLDQMLGEYEAHAINNYICDALTDMHFSAHAINRHILGNAYPLSSFRYVDRFDVPHFSPVRPYIRDANGQKWIGSAAHAAVVRRMEM